MSGNSFTRPLSTNTIQFDGRHADTSRKSPKNCKISSNSQFLIGLDFLKTTLRTFINKCKNLSADHVQEGSASGE
jgi:hypothetical protein